MSVVDQKITVGGNGGRGQLDFNLSPVVTGSSGSNARLAQSLLVIGDGPGSQGSFNILQTGKNRFLNSDGAASQVTTGAGIVGNSGGNGTATVTRYWQIQSYGDGGHDGLHIGVGANSTGTVNVLSGGKVGYSEYVLFAGPLPRTGPIGFVIGEAGGTGILNVSGTNTVDPARRRARCDWFGDDGGHWRGQQWAVEHPVWCVCDVLQH